MKIKHSYLALILIASHNSYASDGDILMCGNNKPDYIKVYGNNICDAAINVKQLENSENIKNNMYSNPNNPECTLSFSMPGWPDFSSMFSGSFDLCRTFQNIADRTINDKTESISQEIQDTINNFERDYEEQFEEVDGIIDDNLDKFNP